MPYYVTHSLAVNRYFPLPLPHSLSYIGCCRAVLMEVYEGLMLPLPPELYCSPATNPTLDSSDSEETPLRSLQEPVAPKMVTGNAKRYDFCSMLGGEALSLSEGFLEEVRLQLHFLQLGSPHKLPSPEADCCEETKEDQSMYHVHKSPAGMRLHVAATIRLLLFIFNLTL